MKTKMKQLFGILLSLAMVLGLMPGMSLTVYATPTGTEVTQYTGLPNSAGTYYLSENISIDSTWTVPSGTTTLDLNGYGIRMTGDNSAILVGSGRNLTISDGNATRKHYITLSDYRGTAVNDTGTPSAVTNGSGVVEVTGGYITGGNHTGNAHYGGAILFYSGNGSFTMTGGSIIGNRACCGGAIAMYYDNTSVSFNGTLFAYNLAEEWGGGIWHGDTGSGNLTLTNCTMRGNRTSKTNNGGGGAISSNKGTSNLYINGGLFEQNTSARNGSCDYAIFVQSNLHISGGPVIVDNVKDANRRNIYLDGDKKISIDGALTDGASIGITMKTPGVFTNSENTDYNVVSKFISDNTTYHVEKDSTTNQLKLVTGSSYTVTLTGGANATRSGGDATQPSLTGSMTTVTYTANAGYHFAEFTDITSNGVTATRTSDTVVTVSGTPSGNASITVPNAVAISATAPTISTQPQDLDLTYGYTTGSLSVTAAEATDATYDLSYQWYSNTMNSNSTGTEISGATTASYTIPTGKNAGTTEYYYCVVTATRTDNSQTATITSDVATVTVNAANATSATVTANNRTNDGTEKPLVTVTGEAEGGTMQYALGDDAANPPASGWSETIPTGTDVGIYYVWYYVKGDGTHTDSKPVCITVTIAGAVYTATDKEYTITSGEDTVVTVNREPDNSKTFGLYTGAQMDGKALPEGSNTTAEGSLVLTLKAAYLDTLSVGDHKLTIAFQDGSATATIKVKEAEPTATPAPTAAPTPTPKPKPVPRTGDSADLALWLGLILLGLLGIGGFAVMKSRK